MRVYEALRELGYEGGYDAVRRYARSWYREQSAAAIDAYVPLSFDPGEAYQFDWSHEIVLIKASRVQGAHRLGWHDGEGEGRPCAALPQPDAVCPGLSARDPDLWITLRRSRK